VTDTSPQLQWRKSSRSSDEGECVEVAALPSGTVAVRDSKNPNGPHLTLSRQAFRTLLDQAGTDAFTLGR
jgi:hypothetical protein